MKKNLSSYDTLRNIFKKEITAIHIAEELKYCHPDVGAIKIKETMESLDFDVIGISDDDQIKGYVEISDLNDLNLNNHIKSFNSTELIEDSTPLFDILPILKIKSRIFVQFENEIWGIITVSDLQKITVRIFLFGLISLLEMKMTQIIRNRYPNDTWKQKINPNHYKTAQNLQKNQKSTNENIELIDYLQLSDKNKIILKSPEVMTELGYDKKYFKDLLGSIINLRNILAHSRDLEDPKSSKIIDLSLKIDKLIGKMAKLE